MCGRSLSLPTPVSTRIVRPSTSTTQVCMAIFHSSVARSQNSGSSRSAFSGHACAGVSANNAV